MFRCVSRPVLVALTVLPLMAFRMPAASESLESLLYDVRGVFVTARPTVPQELVIATDMLVDEAVRATVRKTMLPRTIISVRIDQISRLPLMIGSRHEAKVTVKVIAVASGDPIAEGSFKTSVFLLDNAGADRALAQRIADRITTEFRLDGPGRPAIVNALFP
ncbi:hypothetical protein CYG48_07900 [Neorhizobium sp. SOG26]|uniref:hypothetical protein n=1 Tax=Neorhizobium sp. SOG26 TaxID=2060726 RepID=UPI000E57FE77|nr:hypothetical protein [Neorhizobium sp. SOG26]AXV15623.1 hypothetical protein CYG48_07900 [Neorhizobium sp. SOG26]